VIIAKFLQNIPTPDIARMTQHTEEACDRYQGIQESQYSAREDEAIRDRSNSFIGRITLNKLQDIATYIQFFFQNIPPI
jgi:hypothetical protein